MPSETSVSMVVVPWRRLTRVARWNGHADHRMTGVDSANATHSQPENCRPGTIEIATTGMVRTTATTRRGEQLALLVGVGVVASRVGTA